MSTDNQSAQSALDEIKRVCIELERAYAGKDYSRQALFRACGLLGELADSIALAQAPAPSGEPVPPILFDGFAVLQALTPKARARTSAENVADVLDAVVGLLLAL